MNAWLKGLLVVLFCLWGSGAKSSEENWRFVCGDGRVTDSTMYCQSHGGYLCKDGSRTMQWEECDNRGGVRNAPRHFSYACANSRGEQSIAKSFLECWGNGYLFECWDHSRKARLADCMDHGGPAWFIRSSGTGVCGDGVIDIGEQCDPGNLHYPPDTTPDACRTSCRAAYCGDGVTDTGEQCDDGRMGGNGPNQCRKNCTLPYCGDGIVDDQYNEQCDDANKDETDGCRSDCRVCLRVDENQENILADTLLCEDKYPVVDYGDEGTVIIKRPNVVLDCKGAVLQGDGRGVGIVVLRADGAVIRNCTVTGFETGIKVVGSRDVVIRDGQNPLYGNRRGMAKENSEVRLVNLSKPRVMVQAFSGTSATSAAATAALRQAAPHAGTTGKGTGKKKTGISLAGKPSQGKTASVRGKAVGAKPASSSGQALVIRYPRAGQSFNGPVNLVVRLEAKPRKRVIYTLRALPKRKVKARSRTGGFKGIQPGNYCVEAALAAPPTNKSKCVPFMVKAPAKRPVVHPGTRVQPGVHPGRIQPIPRLPVPKSGGGG